MFHHFGHMTSCFSLPLSFVNLQSTEPRAEFLTLSSQRYACPSQRSSSNNSPNEYEHIVLHNLEIFSDNTNSDYTIKIGTRSVHVGTTIWLP